MASAAETNSFSMVAAVLSRTFATLGCSSFGLAACAAAATVNSSKQHTPALSSCFIDSLQLFCWFGFAQKKARSHAPCDSFHRRTHSSAPQCGGNQWGGITVQSPNQQSPENVPSG